MDGPELYDIYLPKFQYLTTIDLAFAYDYENLQGSEIATGQQKFLGRALCAAKGLKSLKLNLLFAVH